MKTVPFREACRSVYRLVHEVERTGETIVVMRAGKPVAELKPLGPDEKKAVLRAKRSQRK